MFYFTEVAGVQQDRNHADGLKGKKEYSLIRIFTATREKLWYFDFLLIY